MKDYFNLKPYYILSAINVVLLALTGFAGLFISSTYVNFVEPLHLAESQGQDFTTLFVGLPLLIIAMIWTQRGSVRCIHCGRSNSCFYQGRRTNMGPGHIFPGIYVDWAGLGNLLHKKPAKRAGQVNPLKNLFMEGFYY